MKKGVIVLKLLAEQMRFEYHTARVWLGIGIGLTMFLIPVQQFMEFVKLRGEPVNLMDCFLYGGLEPQNSMLVVLGYLFIMSDAPFIHERTGQLVMRTSRRIWGSSCLCYIFVQAMIYYLFIFLFSILISQEYGYWGSSWSIPLSQTASQETIMIFQFQVSFPYWQFMQEYTVIRAAILTYLGNVLYVCVLGMILYVFNLNNRVSLGTWIAVFIHFSGYITRKEWNPKWSLQSYASPAENGNIIPLAVIVVILGTILFFYVKKMDYCVIERDI